VFFNVFQQLSQFWSQKFTLDLVNQPRLDLNIPIFYVEQLYKFTLGKVCLQRLLAWGVLQNEKITFCLENALGCNDFELAVVGLSLCNW
jgi:hypothetical protein